MLQPTFHVEADNIATENVKVCRLLILLDDESMSYVIFNPETKQPACIKYFHFSQIKNKEKTEIIREIIYVDPMLSMEVAESFLVYGFPESTLVPDAYFDEGLNKEFTNLMYGNLEKGLVQNEKIPWWDIYNVYRIPTDIQKLLQFKFTSAKQFHYYSLLLKSHKKFSAGLAESIFVIFYQEKVIVTVYKKNQLQLIQSFEYANQMDVAYHLLNCCNRFDLQQNQVSLQISGFIEKQSAIYHEIAQYFPNISFEETGDSFLVNDKLEEYPLHYFSSLLKLAACV
jgi:hypothetical protein